MLRGKITESLELPDSSECYQPHTPAFSTWQDPTLLCSKIPFKCHLLCEVQLPQERRPLHPATSSCSLSHLAQQLPESTDRFLFARLGPTFVCASFSTRVASVPSSSKYLICLIYSSKDQSLLAHGPSKPQVSASPSHGVLGIVVRGKISKTLSPTSRRDFYLQVFCTPLSPILIKGKPPFKKYTVFSGTIS